MNKVLKFLFPEKPTQTTVSLFLLAMRILFGILFLQHGLQKWANFETLSTTFPDPLGVGHQLSFGLAVFAEIACSVGFITGALYRLALIPMMIMMGVAYFVIHAGDPFAAKELAFIYLAVFVLMFFAGPGTYALDRFITVPLFKKR